jgi:hypothetical protein
MAVSIKPIWSFLRPVFMAAIPQRIQAALRPLRLAFTAGKNAKASGFVCSGFPLKYKIQTRKRIATPDRARIRIMAVRTELSGEVIPSLIEVDPIVWTRFVVC